MIICDNVSKFILKDVDLHIPEGVAVGIIGASGAGKTTFLKLAAGLLAPDEGSIYTNRCNPVTDRKRLLTNMAVLFADVPVFTDGYSTRTFFDDMRSIYDIDKTQFEEQLSSIASKLGFLKIIDSVPKNLSLGQRRRAELGAALVRDVGLYILDEPCIGLDQNGKTALYEIVKGKKADKATVLVSSHNMEDISALADRILLLDKGRVAFYGAKEELYKRLAPIDECCLEFEGAVPDISDLEIESYRIEDGKMNIRYNTNHVSSKEVLDRIISSTVVKSVNIRKSDLSESIKNLNSYKNHTKEGEQL